MGRAPRVDIGGEVYHIINRANNRTQIFKSDDDYKHFERLLKEANERIPVGILAYVLMPNHWHLVLHPKRDGDLSLFMHWLTLTHTQQYHAKTKTIGHGHLYQGRYKAFIVEQDDYLIQLIRYVERNPLRARLERKAEDWRWGSAWRRYNGTASEKRLLAELPTKLPHGYRSWLNDRDDLAQLEAIRTSVNKGTPYGTMNWVDKMVKKFDLLLTTRTRGRPKKTEKGT